MTKAREWLMFSGRYGIVEFLKWELYSPWRGGGSVMNLGGEATIKCI